MANKLTDKKSIRMLSMLGWLVYFSGYITRLNFDAILVEFLQAEGIMKSAAAPITTALLITYGTGQLISGYLGDRVPPRFLIFGGLLVASVCNIIMPLVSPAIPIMTLVWGINGIAQAMMWPPLVKICSNALSEEDYTRLMPLIGTSCAVATIAVYLVSPLIIHLANWKAVFTIAASVAAAVAVIWAIMTRPLLKKVSFAPVVNKKKKVAEKPVGHCPAWTLLPAILGSIAVLGILKDGIKTWMPTFMSETFRLESTVSILLGVVLPLSHMSLDFLVYRILVWMKRDVFAALCVSYGATAVFLLLLSLSGLNSMLLSTVFIAIASGGLHIVNALQTYYLPELFGGKEKISFYAGLVNSATCVGSAVSIYLVAVISEMYGWNTTIVSWMIFAFVGLLLTLLCMIILRKKGQTGRV